MIMGSGRPVPPRSSCKGEHLRNGAGTSTQRGMRRCPACSSWWTPAGGAGEHVGVPSKCADGFRLKLLVSRVACSKIRTRKPRTFLAQCCSACCRRDPEVLQRIIVRQDVHTGRHLLDVLHQVLVPISDCQLRHMHQVVCLEVKEHSAAADATQGS